MSEWLGEVNSRVMHGFHEVIENHVASTLVLDPVETIEIESPLSGRIRHVAVHRSGRRVAFEIVTETTAEGAVLFQVVANDSDRKAK